MNKSARLGQGGGLLGEAGEILWQVYGEISTCAEIYAKLLHGEYNEKDSYITCCWMKFTFEIPFGLHGLLAFLSGLLIHPSFSTMPPSSD